MLAFTKEVHTLHHYHFSIPLGLESKVAILEKKYIASTPPDHAVIHDMDNLDIIYEVVYFENGLKKISRRTKERIG